MNRPNIPLTSNLDGVHAGETIVIIGCAKYLQKMDLHPLIQFTTIGCNRGLLHPYFRPNYLMVSDRRPYMKEMEAGHYKRWAERVKMMFSTSLYDPIIKCHHTPVQTPPKDFPWIPWRVRGSASAMNWKTLSESVNSFANIGGPMLQAAVIMGAKRICMMGFGILVKAPEHFYKDKESWSNRPSPPSTERCFLRAKKELDKMDVEIVNCSLENGRLEKIFGRYSYGDFLQEEL